MFNPIAPISILDLEIRLMETELEQARFHTNITFAEILKG